MLQNWNWAIIPILFTVVEMWPALSRLPVKLTELRTESYQGSRYQSQLSPNAKKKCFWHKNISFGENEWKKKNFPPKKLAS